MIPADEIKRMIETVRRANTGVSIRAAVLSKQKREEAMILVCCCRASGETKEAWDVWVEEEADWEGFLKVTNRSSQTS